jgi:hypothetical protein
MLGEQKPVFILFPVSFYVSISISTPIMFLYVVLIYRNYIKDLRKMYSGDFYQIVVGTARFWKLKVDGMERQII